MSADALSRELIEQRLRNLCGEVESRLRSGERLVAEKILGDNPDFAEAGEFALELIYREFTTLDDLGCRVDAAELCRRFPQWSARIQRLLAVHDALRDDEFDQADTGLLPHETPTLDSTPDLLHSDIGLTPSPAGRGASRLGPYELLEEIGRGGTGVVYRARQIELNRIVALKVISSGHTHSRERLRFQREAESAARLQHPNIVQVYGAGEEAGIPYLSMEYVAGGSLREQLRDELPTEHIAAEWIAQLAEAMHFAHELGIVHRDLKPANVLLQASTSGASGPTPKITDFGLAKRAWEDQCEQTRTGTILGTPAYMAPEQAGGGVREVGAASDVYALGAILYEMIAGQPPFHAASLLETLEHVRTHDPVPLSRRRPEVSRDMETICLKCLEKNPAARYATARLLAEDLRRFLDGQPIQARPTGPVERICKLAKRRPAVASLMATVLLLIVAGCVSAAWQWRQTSLRQHHLTVALHNMQKAREDERVQRERLSASDYFHRISLAHRELLSGNITRVNQLFDGCRTSPHRGWEWLYLNQLLHGSRRSLSGHRLFVYGLDFSPDGGLLASTSGRWGHDDPGEILIWDVQTGERRQTLRGHPGPILSAAFGPGGRLLATSGGRWVSEDCEVMIWEVATGKAITRLDSRQGRFHSVAFRPDGHLLAAGGRHDIQVWAFPSSGESWLLKGHSDTIFEVAFSPDGTTLASASRDLTVRIWDPMTRQCLRVLQTSADQRSVQFSPDGRFLAAGDWDGVVRIWDVNDDFRLVAEHVMYEGAVLCIRFSPDGQRLGVATDHATVRLVDPLNGSEYATFRGHSDQAACIAFSPDGSVLASGGTDRIVNLWDLTADQNPIVIPAVDAHVAEIAFNPTGDLLAVAAKQNTATHGIGEKVIAILDLPQRKELKRLRGHTDWLTSVTFSPDGRQIATGSQDRSARIWDLSSGQVVHEFIGHMASVTDVAFTHDGRRLATSSADQTIRLWECSTGEPAATLRGHTAAVTSVDFDPNNSLLLSAGEDHVAINWDVATGEQLAILEGHTDSLTQASFSPNGCHVATAGTDFRLILWEVSFSEDGQLAVVPRHTLEGQTPSVRRLSFTPDSRRLAAADPLSIKIFDVASGYEALSLDRTGHYPFDVAFSPDGTKLASGNIAIWTTEH